MDVLAAQLVKAMLLLTAGSAKSEWMVGTRLSFPRMFGELARVPISNSPQRQSELASHSPGAQTTLVAKAKRRFNCGPRVHLRQSMKCGEGDSNPHVLSDTTT